MRLMTTRVAMGLALLGALALTHCKKKDQSQGAQSGFQQGQSGGPYGPGPGPGPGPADASTSKTITFTSWLVETILLGGTFFLVQLISE